VDMHAHLMGHLGFGKKLIHGAPDIGSIVPAGNSPFGNACNFSDFRATSMTEALGNCNSTHGGWGLGNTCGNYIRAIALRHALDEDFTFNLDFDPFGGGNLHGDHRHEGIENNFLYWPNQTSKSHQQMWWEWIKRAHEEGGLNVMVALAVNSELLAEALGGSEPKDDRNSADLQVDEIITFVGRHTNFMEIAYTSADLRRIVAGGKLAVIVGMEVDNIGNFNKLGVAVSEASVRAEIQRLYDKGVRYLFPIHLVDNKFGGSAVYEDLFNFANRYSTSTRVGQIEVLPGSLYSVTTSTDPLITFRLGSGLDRAGNLVIKGILDAAATVPYPPALNLDPFSPDYCPIPTLGCWKTFRLVSGLLAPDPRYLVYAATPGGHVNAQGLSGLGKFAVKEMMRLGMLIDIDHMSQKAVDETLDLAENAGSLLRPGYGRYPVNIGHNGIRVQGGNERHASVTTARRVAALGGVFGVGTGDSEKHHVDAQSFISGFKEAWLQMGDKAVAMGTDVNGQERLPRKSAGLDSATFYSNGFQKCSTPTPTGTRTWDYTTDGVAHYGLMADFVKDVRDRDPAVYANLMKSAEYFAKMWESAEAQSRLAP
jgi:microsomal dipeptidase-like Zn-dependent dipeptidase